MLETLNYKEKFILFESGHWNQTYRSFSLDPMMAPKLWPVPVSEQKFTYN